MKIRNGFVSNSSSSSFVLLGIKIEGYDNAKEIAQIFLKKEKYEEYLKEEDTEWEDILWEDQDDFEFDVIIDDVPIYIGKKLAKGDSDSCYLEDKSFNFKELKKFEKELKKKIDYTWVTLYGKECASDMEIKLYMGEYSC